MAWPHDTSVPQFPCHPGLGVCATRARLCAQPVPFLYEIRALLDWSCTATTLDLKRWLTLEDVRSALYNTACVNTMRSLRRLGARIPRYVKLMQVRVSATYCIFIYISLPLSWVLCRGGRCVMGWSFVACGPNEIRTRRDASPEVQRELSWCIEASTLELKRPYPCEHRVTFPAQALRTVMVRTALKCTKV